MEEREIGLQVLYNRIKDRYKSLGIKTFRRTPSIPVEQDDLLCVFMTSGIDRIVKPSARDWLGYPARREVEVIFELISLDDFDIQTFYTDFRRVALSSAKLTDDCIVREVRAIGPSSYNTPNVIGMRLVCAMAYTDKG
jgi:hypothetical protein